MNLPPLTGFIRKHAIKLYNIIRNVVCNVKNVKLIFCGAKTENVLKKLKTKKSLTF